jgi:hypothetical protein
MPRLPDTSVRAADLDATATLFRAYAAWLEIDLAMLGDTALATFVPSRDRFTACLHRKSGRKIGLS